MLNEEKIRIMTAMAAYEKKYGSHDRTADSYYMGDYIFKKNSWTRILIFIGAILVFLFYLVMNIVNENMDIFTMDFKEVLFKFGVILIILMVVYTAMGTAINKKKYDEAQERLKELDYLKKRVAEIEHESREKII